MNRKNAIQFSLYALIIACFVGLYITSNNEIAELQETLNEKETVISDMGKTVDTLEKKNKELENNLIDVRQENTDLRDGLMKITEEVDGLKNDKEKLQSDLSTLNNELNRVKKELQAAKKVKPVSVTQMPSRGSESKSKTFYVSATAYTAYCAGCSGVTRTGLDLRANPGLKVIAVDPSIIPLGSKVWVEGYGYAIAGDTGGAIKGYKIDIFMPNRSDALKWGRQRIQVRVL